MAESEYDKKYICTTLKEEVRAKEAANPPGKRIMDHIIWMDNEVIPGAMYSEVVWFWPGVIGPPEEQRQKPGLAQHSHPFDEVLAYLGTDPKDPHDLGGEIEFWLEDRQFNMTKSFLVYIPAGMKHCPLKHITIDRPIFHFTMGPGSMYTWEGPEKKAPQLEDKSKYFVYQSKSNLKLPEFRHPIPPDRAHRLFYLDSEVVPGANFYTEALWFWPRQMNLKPGEIPKGAPEPHTHTFGEFIGFFGSNTDDIHDLCGEVELWIDGKKNVMRNSFLAFVPAGVEHCPLVLRKVDRPIFHFTAGPTQMYTL
jgi:mannose-6-phosphate isomerase-like protein (cupin superfamily)